MEKSDLQKFAIFICDNVGYSSAFNYDTQKYYKIKKRFADISELYNDVVTDYMKKVKIYQGINIVDVLKYLEKNFEIAKNFEPAKTEMQQLNTNGKTDTIKVNGNKFKINYAD